MTREARGNVRDTRGSAAAQLSVQVKEYCKSNSSDCAGVARIFAAHARVENSSTREEHPLATYLKRKRTSNSATIAHPLATCLDDKDDTAYHLTHFRLLRPRAPRPSVVRHTCDRAHRDLVRCVTPATARTTT
ncbi:hypothetical protein EDB84DRAFT_1572409 [Lactarius hengduanensis]|nr:hypothetical protein EDB84DRAFT_1572409 [Lactarius hengduanensis]